jgi:peptidylprolyl isomerase
MKLARGIAGLCIVAAVLYLAVANAGCGGSNGSPDASAKETSEAGLRSSPPEIKPPLGFPPKKLIIKDMVKGTGKEAKKGDRVAIQYYGVDWKLGSEHASSWRYANIPVFELGNHRLLRGLNMGIPGMKEGGSREIIIPYNLVYYPGGHHRALGPLDALVYKVYLVKDLGKKY